MCEDCKAKHAGFGLGADKKKRWCGKCAKSHEGAMYLASGPKKMCEDCKGNSSTNQIGHPSSKK